MTSETIPNTEVAQPETDPEPPREAIGVEPASGTALLALASDTPDDEIHYRQATSRGGQPVMVNGQPLNLAYVTARYVSDRLDDVVGPANWQDSFNMVAPGVVQAGIGIRVGDTEWVWKYDVGVASNIEPEKGAYSDAFKRAAVKWGIARDLYDERDDKVGAPEGPSQPQQQPLQQQQPGQPLQQMVTEAQSAPMAPAQQPMMQPQQGFQPQGQYPPTDPNWVCPIHQLVKIVPAGVSRKNGRAYPAFQACSAPGCDQKGGSLT